MFMVLFCIFLYIFIIKCINRSNHSNFCKMFNKAVNLSSINSMISYFYGNNNDNVGPKALFNKMVLQLQCYIQQGLEP